MCNFQGRVIFLKRDIQPRGISAKVPNKLSFFFGQSMYRTHIFYIIVFFIILTCRPIILIICRLFCVCYYTRTASVHASSHYDLLVVDRGRLLNQQSAIWLDVSR